MFCPNCGYNCGDANFCSNCGRRLRAELSKHNAETDGFNLDEILKDVDIYSLPGEGVVTGQSRTDRKKELQEAGKAYCPKCLSTSITTNTDRTFDHYYLFVHGTAAKTITFLLMMLERYLQKRMGMECVCMKCGYRWNMRTKRQNRT